MAGSSLAGMQLLMPYMQKEVCLILEGNVFLCYCFPGENEAVSLSIKFFRDTRFQLLPSWGETDAKRKNNLQRS